MIKTQSDFDNACNFIDSDMELYDFQLSEKMTSYEYNLYFQDTEYFLNRLYEKIRTLEELCDYLDYYVDTKIGRAKENIDQKIAILESIVLRNKTNEGQISAPTWNQTETVTDRDGTLLSTAICDKGHIEGNARLTNQMQPISLQLVGGNKPYAQTNDFVHTGRYAVKYQESEKKDIETKVRIFLPEAEYNYISFTPLGAEITAEYNEDNQYVDLLLKPSVYNKVARPFDYDVYTTRCMDHIRPKPPTEFDLEMDGMNISAQQKVKLDTQFYQQEVERVQDRNKENDAKSEVWQKQL